MNTTSASLLLRMRRPDQREAWVRFVKLYTPLLQFWARRLGLQDADSADLLQDVFATLVEKLPEFRYNQKESFRSWLRTVLLNKWRNRVRQRTPVTLEGDDPAFDGLTVPDDAAIFCEAEYRKHLVARALQLMQAEFPPRMWQACWEHVVVGRAADEVAAELGIAPGTVYVAKARILNRLREELEGLLD